MQCTLRVQDTLVSFRIGQKVSRRATKINLQGSPPAPARNSLRARRCRLCADVALAQSLNVPLSHGALKSAYLDGELCALYHDGVSSFSLGVNSAQLPLIKRRQCCNAC